MNDLKNVIKQLKPASILVIGDLILDHYLIGNAYRISPEAPVPVVSITQETYHVGGAGNVAANLTSLNMLPIISGVIGDDRWGKKLVSLMQKRKINCSAVVTDMKRTTTDKTRILAGGQQIVRFDREITEKLSNLQKKKLLEKIGRLKKIDAVIISDYGKGVVTESLISELKKLFGNIIIAVDPKITNFSYYKGATFLTPNLLEASRMANIRIDDNISLIQAGKIILNNTQANMLVITQGQQGMTIFADGKIESIKATAGRYVYDVTGAGDSVIAAVTAAIANGIDFFDACRLANAAGGISVSHPGTYSVTYKELSDEL